jgi:hypothetical protein
MAKPGPAKGKGGAPRKTAATVAKRADGYKRVTTGAKGKGTQRYVQRVKLGLGKGSKGKTTVAHHKDHNRSNNAKSNLVKTTKKGNRNK